jgi:hypothetical protein
MAKNRITFSNELVLRDGKVGIGTSAPNSQLSVFGAAEIEGVIKIVSSGTTSGEIIEQKHYRDNGGSIAYESGDRHLFSVSNDSENKIYVINDDDGSPVLEITNSGVTTITNLQQQEVNFLSVGSTETSKITAKHYSTNDGSLALQSGDENLFSVTNERDLYYSINDSEAKPALTVSDLGITTVRDLFQNRVNFTSVGSTAIENIQINHYQNIAYQPAVGSTTNNKGAISFDSSAGISSDGITFFPASLFAVSNGGGNIFSVGGYRYFSGSPFPVIDVTYSGRLGIGTTNPQSDFNINTLAFFSGGIGVNTFTPAADVEIRGNLLVSGDNLATNRVFLKPQSSGINTFVPARGGISYEGDIATGDTGGQLLTILNNNSSLLTINNFVGLSSANFAPAGQRNIVTLFEISSNGRVGIGTSVPTATLDVRGPVNITGISTIAITSTTNPTTNSTMSFELTDNTTLTVRVRGTDGVVRTGIVSLS